MPYTQPEDVRDRWIGKDEIPADDDKITRLLADAEDMILTDVPDLAARMADGRVPHERLVRIVVRMVMRHLHNPTGVRQFQQTTGPFTNSATMGGDNPGALYFDDADRRELLGEAKRRGGRKAFTIMPRLR